MKPPKARAPHSTGFDLEVERDRRGDASRQYDDVTVTNAD
jgi:hypothetical protein